MQHPISLHVDYNLHYRPRLESEASRSARVLRRAVLLTKAGAASMLYALCALIFRSGDWR